MAFLEGVMVALREVRKKDLLIFSNIRNNYDTSKYFRTVMPLTDWNQEQYWETIVNNNNGRHIIFTIILRSTSEVIGEIRASNISYQGAEIGIIIDCDYHNKGMATEALQLFLKFIFGRTTINRIEAKVAFDNFTAVSFFERNGFIKEGIMREATYYDYEYRDVVLLSLLKKDFYQNKS